MEGLVEVVPSGPEFRRTDKGNIRHRAASILLLVVPGHVSKCVGRAETIGFGPNYSGQCMSGNGMPSGPPLPRGAGY